MRVWCIVFNVDYMQVRRMWRDVGYGCDKVVAEMFCGEERGE